MPNNKCENHLLSILSAQEWHLDRLYAEYSREFGFIFQNYSGRESKLRKKQLDKALQQFNEDLGKLLAEQIGIGFQASNICQDEFVSDYIKGIDVPESQVNRLFTKNTGAARAFINRSENGLRLSDRVWKLTQQTEESLNVILESGVVNGRSAADMARDLKMYLKDPDKRFRRTRDENGKLQLSTPAKNYHPGRGVYRSSYKNALRLSRNEINIAYRTNDFERRKNMPFVMGQRIQLSAAHPAYDICDEMIGTYPKEFRFVGWHPNCLCFSTSILLPREKFKEYLAGGSIDGRHTIKTIPAAAQNYLNENASRIHSYKSKPYFIEDNFKYRNGMYLPKKASTPNILPESKPEPSRELKAARLIRSVDTFTDNEIKKTLLAYSEDRPELFYGGLKKVSISKSIGGLMHNSRYYFKGQYDFAKGNEIALKRASYKMGDDSIFSPSEDVRGALTAIKEGKEFTFNQEYAMEALWHEIRHSGAKGWGNINARSKYNINSMEIVNQFCARHTYDEFISDLGGKAVHKKAVIEKGYGYSFMIDNFRKTLTKYGITERNALDFLKDRIQNEKYEDIHQILVEYLKSKGVKDSDNLVVRMGILKAKEFEKFLN